MLMKFDLCSFTMASSSRLLSSVCLAAIIERIENERSASVTDKVPSAESFRPVTGNTSACMYSYVDQLLRWRASDPDRKRGGFVLERGRVLGLTFQRP